jgi:GH24 family phage-related lysozyme (muramidase)
MNRQGRVKGIDCARKEAMVSFMYGVGFRSLQPPCSTFSLSIQTD